VVTDLTLDKSVLQDVPARIFRDPRGAEVSVGDGSPHFGNEILTVAAAIE